MDALKRDFLTSKLSYLYQAEEPGAAIFFLGMVSGLDALREWDTDHTYIFDSELNGLVGNDRLTFPKKYSIFHLFGF